MRNQYSILTSNSENCDVGSILGLLNNSGPTSTSCPEKPPHTKERECSKKIVQPCPEQSRREGRSPFDARSVLSVREHGKRARTPLAGFFNIPILAVDDDPDIGMALTDFLEQEGYAVTMVETGQAAIEESENHQFHAVILDLGLPDRDGLEVLAHMLSRDPELPIIILTAYSSLERNAPKIGQCRAFAYLSKPFDRKKLKATICRAIQTRLLVQQDPEPA